ncbi:sialidase family protein [Streptomyces hainanensis]|uniref:Glycosyl hydrolase n=1 Tax=Streptomyces hainanensis TaxID=402648 RepID=A0A4R4TLK6_9ACTN|nr:exo-alpha-sialidase [Streptomyces hainanensis]TDC76023.1 glycosyl hydrolase [Streptomyces hainanensis]
MSETPAWGEAPPEHPDGVLRPRPEDPDVLQAFLPAPAVQNHAASLTVLPDGALGCVWFGGTQEGVPDISIWFSRLAPGGAAWEAPVRLSDDPDRSEQNPLLFPTPAGELWLLHTAQRAGDQDTAEVRLRVSVDGGRSWDAPRTLFPAGPEGGVFVRQPPVVLASGRWLLPIFRCVPVPGTRWTGEQDTSSVLISDDAGRDWRERPVPESTGQVHMNIQPLADGTLVALFRSRWADRVHRSVSRDDGETWTAPEPTGLPNNNSSLQCLVLADGRLALVHNHSSRADASARRVSLYDEIDEAGQAGEARPPAAEPAGRAFWGAPRAPLTLAISADGGLSWPLRRDVATGDGHCLTNNSRDRLNRELSYPTIAQTPDGALHIAFTYWRQTITHVRVTPDWAAGPATAGRAG